RRGITPQSGGGGDFREKGQQHPAEQRRTQPVEQSEAPELPPGTRQPEEDGEYLKLNTQAAPAKAIGEQWERSPGHGAGAASGGDLREEKRQRGGVSRGHSPKEQLSGQGGKPAQPGSRGKQRGKNHHHGAQREHPAAGVGNGTDQ